MQAEQQPPAYEMAATFEEERREFLEAAAINLNRAYGDDEPDYSDVPAYTLRQRLADHLTGA
jgi:hypothetical protein